MYTRGLGPQRVTIWSQISQTHTSSMMFHSPPLLVSLFRIMQGTCSTADEYLVSDYIHRFIHKERTPHPYAISWTTHRECHQNVGSDFYLCQYAVRVRSAADTFIVWPPKDYHGTSLPCCTPASADDDVEGFSQVSLAMVTPPGLVGQWKRVQAKEISCKQAEDHVAMGTHS